MASKANFVYRASADDGRVINLELSSHLRVTAAQIDGKPAEFLQHGNPGITTIDGGAPLLLVAAEPLAADIPHRLSFPTKGPSSFAPRPETTLSTSATLGIRSSRRCSQPLT